MTAFVQGFHGFVVLAGLSVVLAFARLPQSANSAETGVTWKTGNDFREQLERGVSIRWQGTALRDAIHGLSRSQGVAIWLDRRIDPDQLIEFEEKSATLDEMLRRLGSRFDFQVCHVGSVIYLGPAEITAKLPTLAAVKRQSLEKLPADAKRRWSKAVAVQWNDLEKPRELMDRWLGEVDAKYWKDDGQKIPHDLWGAKSLPPLSLADRLTLLLAGFDLTFFVDPANGTSVALKPIPEKVSYEQSYVPKGDATKLVVDLTKQFPNAVLKREGNRVRVTGLYEEHELIERLLRGERIQQRKVTEGEKRYSLAVKDQPLRAILAAVATQLKLDVEFAPATQGLQDKRYTWEITDLPRDEMLQSLGQVVGASFMIQDTKLLVSPLVPKTQKK